MVEFMAEGDAQAHRPGCTGPSRSHLVCRGGHAAGTEGASGSNQGTASSRISSAVRRFRSNHTG
jgi:hypothetical protein